MNQSRAEFILDLISDKRLTTFQKEKIISLAILEIQKVHELETTLINDVETIKKIILSELIHKASVTKVEKPLTKVKKQPSPKDVALFMSLFNDPIGLKYLTHDFDESEKLFEIESFLEKSKRIFMDFAYTKVNIPQSLYQIVNQFAFIKEPNWGNGIKEGWSSPHWIDWSKKEHKHLKRNPDFAKIIEAFRRLTRVEAPELKSIILGVLEEKLNDKFASFDIEIVDCEKADFYTNVVFFKQALKFILDGVYKRSEISKNLTIKYIREPSDDYLLRIISINHIGSYPSRPIDEIKSEIESGKGDLYEVREKLNGYCYWSIETRWNNLPMRLNILNDQNEIFYENLPDNFDVQGFNHILTFYYK